MIKEFLTKIDLPLFIATLLVLIFGLVGLYSIKSEFARAQTIYAAFSVICFFLFALLDYRHLRAAAPFLLLAAFIMLLAVVLFGKEIGGASRWFVVGPLFFAPSEFAKLALAVSLAYFFYDKSAPLSFRNLLISGSAVALLCVLVLLQPSLGTALVMAAVWVGIVWVAGIAYRYIFAGLVSVAVLSPVVWNSLKEYQRERIISFLNPALDPLGAGYNVIQSMIAVGSGRLFGKGFGMGTQSHLQFLPVRHTDFIFAALTEEWGLLGAGILLFLLAVILWRILTVVTSCKDKFGLFLGIGIFSLLFAQIAINIGMNIGIAPVTGLPLPLVSYGGSSLLFTLIGLGIVQSLAVHRDDRS